MRRLRLLLMPLLVVVFLVVGESSSFAVFAPPSPPAQYKQTQQCVSANAAPTTVKDDSGISWGQQALQYAQAWQFSTGAHVRVAVIDTGVNDEAAFGHRLSGLADLVTTNDSTAPAGLDDCDGHGTLVAGIIGANPDSVTGFAGVAPDVTLMSIRQSSTYYGPANTTTSTGDPDSGVTSGNTAGTRASLAAAIDYAVANHAQVINISVAHCGAAGIADNNEALTAAVNAAFAADVVIVAAAGNLSSSGTCSQQNVPAVPPATANPVTRATPADLPHVLAVAAVAQDGTPASFSLAGPWVGVAAPGTAIVSTNPVRDSTGQVAQLTDSSGTTSIQGTSFAAPYVTGLAALVRSRFPNLSAQGVIDRIEQTAVHPAAAAGRNDYVGYGLIDPVAALTRVLPADTGTVTTSPGSLPVAPTVAVSGRSRAFALTGALIVLAALVVFGVGLQSLRTRRRRARARVRAQLIRREAASAITPVRPPRSPVP